MDLTRFKIAKKDIISHLESLDQKVFKHSDIDKILTQNREFWRLTQDTTTRMFTKFLFDEGFLKEHKINFPNRSEIRYVWKEASDYEIIQSLRPKSYFTHFTAMFLHGLTLQIPKTVYLNYEQVKKKNLYPELAQNRIDYAFRRPCRVSNTIAEFGDKRICLLNGKNTGHAGVIDFEEQDGTTLRVTNIERTLIDIVVRPVYSGGVHNVIDAFRNAKDKVSINKLAALLSTIGYIYPYHQAIGFYLERSNVYSEKQIMLIEGFEKNFNFYLTHQMKEKEYSERWKLFFPKGL